MSKKESYNLVGSSKCREILATYPNYKVFIRSGFAWKGASEHEDDKPPHEEYVWQERRKRVMDFEERMRRLYNWAAAIDIEVDNDKQEIHFNAFSPNDLY